MVISICLSVSKFYHSIKIDKNPLSKNLLLYKNSYIEDVIVMCLYQGHNQSIIVRLDTRFFYHCCNENGTFTPVNKLQSKLRASAHVFFI